MFKNSVSYKGSARVLLKNLELDRMRYIDQTKVTKFIKRFEAAGCHHDDLGESSLAVLIDFEKSQHSLAAAGFPKLTDHNEQNSLPLDLPETVKFTLLYGDHRVLAAQKHLPAKHRWWTVHVFDSGISTEDRARVMQKTSQAPNGRVLAAMLNVRDRALLDSWKLEKHQKTTFKRLRDADEQHLHGAVRNLLCYRGLQESAGGNWAPVLEMHCFEEVYAYLSAVERTWKYILGTDIRPDQLDESTVVALQMQIPDSSTDDCDAICRLFDNNKVFPLVEDQHRRKRLSERVLNCKRILSFQSFFDDFRYIRPCFESLSILLPEGSWREDKSFQQVFRHNWNGNTQHDSRKHDFLSCYIELWLFAMRDFPSLSSGKASLPLQDKASTKKLIRSRLIVPKKEFELAYNASLLGFHTCEIERFKSMHPSGIQQVGPDRLPPEYSCDDPPLPRTARSNRPSESSYLQDRDYLHPIYMIHAHPARKKRYATRIAVTKDIVQCCWTDIERWAAPPRRSQNRRFPISISTDEVARHVRSGPKVAKPPTTKPPQRGSFNMASFQRSRYAKSYQELIANPEDTSVSTKMEFSDAFVKAQGMKERINTLHTTKDEDARADQEFDHVAEALQLLENSSSGSGEVTGAFLGARNVLDKKDGCDDPMDMDLPNENNASQGYDVEIETVHDSSLKVEPLNVVIRQDLGDTDDNPGDRKFLSPPPNDTARASSIYSYDMTGGNAQDVTQVLRGDVSLNDDPSLTKSLADDGISNVQASSQHLHQSQQDIDDPGERIPLRHAERTPENAVHTFPQGEAPASHSKLIGDIRKDPSISTAAESSFETVKAQSYSHYDIREGREADDQVYEANKLFDDPSSVDVSTHDGPADSQGVSRFFEPHGDVPNAHDSTSGKKSPPMSISKRTAIRGDDWLHKREDTHDTTIRNAERYRSGDSSVKLNSDGKKATSAELTKGLGEVKPSEKDKPNRATELPFIPNGTMPFGTSNEDGAPSVENGRKRKRFDPNEGYKDKIKRLDEDVQDVSESTASIRSDESL